MDREKYEKWLTKKKFYSTRKQIVDNMCRVAQCEREFKVDLDEEYERDGMAEVCEAASRFGHSPTMKKFLPNSLPINTPGMAVIAVALNKYRRFKEETE